MPPDTSDTLHAEKDYLQTSRAALALMREKTGSLEIDSADPVNPSSSRPRSSGG